VLDYTDTIHNRDIKYALEEINNIKEYVLNDITPQKLLKNIPHPTEKELREAQAFIDYLYTKDGTKEFLALSLTNQDFMNYLSDIKIDKVKKFANKERIKALEEQTKDQKFIGRMIDTIFDLLVRLYKKILEALHLKMSVDKNLNASEAMHTLALSMANAHGNMVKKSFIDPAITAMNTYTNDVNRKVFEYISKKALPKWHEAFKNTKSDTTAIVLGLPLLMSYAVTFTAFNTDTAKETVAAFSRTTGMVTEIIGKGYRGTTYNLFKQSIIDPDKFDRELQALAIMSKKIDSYREDKATAVADFLIKSFSRRLDDNENKSITRAILMTDMQSLLDDKKTIDEQTDYLYKVVSSKEFRNKEIKKNADFLENAVGDSATLFINKAKILANAMVTGSHGLIDMNAHQIAGKINNREIVSKIDKLATLYAIELSDKKDIDNVANLIQNEKTGIVSLLSLHKKYVEESQIIHTKTSNSFFPKGYVKNETDNSVVMEIAPYDKKEEMKINGYKLKKTFVQNGVKLGFYVNKFNVSTNWNKATMRLTSKSLIDGKSMNGIINELHPPKSKDDKIAYYLTRKYNAQMLTEKLSMNDKLRKKRYSIREIRELWNKDYAIEASYSKNGSINNIYIRPSYDLMRKEANKEEKGIYLLSRMVANNYDIKETEKLNNDMVETVYNDFRRNMAKGTKIVKEDKSKKDKKTGRYLERYKYRITKDNVFKGPGYYVIAKNSDVDEFRDAWHRIPPAMLDQIKKQNKKLIEEYPEEFKDLPIDAMIVRKDNMYAVFGYNEPTITNFVSKFPMTRRILRTFEEIWKEIVNLAKVDIVVRTTDVLYGNIMSNIVSAIALGYSPIKVLQHTLDNAIDVRDYFRNENEIQRLSIKRDSVGLTEEETKRLNILKQRQLSSSVNEMMQKGLFNSINEDLALADNNANKATQSKLLLDRAYEKLPGFFQDTISTLYVTDRSDLYNKLMTVMRMSDAIAKSTIIQLRKNDVAAGKLKMTEQEIYNEANDIFVDYNLPDDKLLQYLNNVGVFMFTRYFTRIQRAIKNSFYKNPSSFVMWITLANMMGIDNIGRQFPLVKNFDALTYDSETILDHFLTPTALEYLGIVE
jgi:hypothetical protein